MPRGKSAKTDGISVTKSVQIVSAKGTWQVFSSTYLDTCNSTN